MDFPGFVVQNTLLHVSNNQHAGQGKREENEKLEKYGTKRDETKKENRVDRVLRMTTIR